MRTILLTFLIISLCYSIKIQFFYAQLMSDFGWNYQHELARVKLSNIWNYSWGDIETEYMQNLTDQNTTMRIIQEKIDQGFTVFVGNSYPTYKASFRKYAMMYPDVNFLLSSPFFVTDLHNLRAYMLRTYEAYYYFGLLSALALNNTDYCYFLSFNNTAPLLEMNAFAIGIYEINPQAVIHTFTLNTWSNSTLVKYSFDQCLKLKNVQAFAQSTEGINYLSLAMQHNMSGFGEASDLRILIGESVLSSVQRDYSYVFRDAIRDAIHNNWTNVSGYWYGKKQNSIDHAPLSFRITKNIENIANQLFLANYDSIFNISVSSEWNVSSFSTYNQVISFAQTHVFTNIIEEGNVVIALMKRTERAYLYNTAGALVLICLIVLSETMIVIIIAHMLMYRDSYVYKQTSVPISIGILVSILISLISPLFLFLKADSLVNCNVTSIVYSITMCITLCFLCIKEYRILLINKNSANLKKTKKIRDGHLFLYVLPFVMICIIIAVLWIMKTPMIPSIRQTDTEKVIYCEYQGEMGIVMFAYVTAISIVGIILGIYNTQSLQATLKKYTDAKKLLITFTNMTIISFLFCIILYFIQMDEIVKPYLVTIWIILENMYIVLYIYFPKLVLYFLKKDKKPSDKSTSNITNMFGKDSK